VGVVSAPHDPPETFRFNTLRSTGGSTRLTLVKAAVDAAGIDPRPPRPELAHLPAAPGVWLAFAVEEFPSQAERVAVRAAVSEALDSEAPVVGEFPVALQGKLGSAVTLVPRELVDRADLDLGQDVTTVSLGNGALLFVTKAVINDDPDAIDAIVQAARAALA
jgi:hypothetical protein